MVSFKPSGRAGNWFFVCATAYAYSLKHGLQFSVPSSTNDHKWNPIYFPNLVNLDYNPNLETVVIQEKTYFKYDELPFEESWRNKNIVLEGYFQNYQYFEQYRDEIVKLLDIAKPTVKGVVSIHVRRGDYVTLRDKHPEVTAQWYEEAMNDFFGFRFKFFSDDIEWCKETFGHRDDCEFSTNTSELEDLIEISSMEHHINSSSTFSWWGAWLNQNPDKIIITPKQWLMPAHSNEWTETIVPPTWIRK